MTAFILYLLQASVCILLFYTAYYLLLRKLTFFKWNRVYLLLALVASVIIPMLNIPVMVKDKSPVKNFIPSWHLQEESYQAFKNVLNNGSHANWGTLLLTVYFIGAFIVLVKLFGGLYTISKVYHKKEMQRTGSARIVNGEGRIRNCSFMKTIFLDPAKLTRHEFDEVVKHELCHIQLHHSYDKIFIHLLQIVFWFNPVVYLYRHSIEEVHEFEVDALLVSKTDRQQYAALLLHFAIETQHPLFNSFSTTPLKARIQMLFNRRSDNAKSISYLIGIPLIAFSILSFGARDIVKFAAKEMKENYDVVTNDYANVLTHDDGVNKVKSLIKNDTGFHETSRVKPNEAVEKTLPLLPITKITEKNIELDRLRASNEIVRHDIVNTTKEENPIEITGPMFFTRTTIKATDGNEYDEVKIRFGKSNLWGATAKGARLLYLIGGKKFEEDEVRQFSASDIAGLSCPCKVQIREKDTEPLFYGSYDGIIEISGKK